MSFEVKVEKSASKRFARIHPRHAAQIAKRLKELQELPRPHDSIKLKGTSDYRLDVGEYRILYAIDYDAQIVTVFRIMQRGEGY